MKKCKIYGDEFYYLFGNVGKINVQVETTKGFRNKTIDINDRISKICESLKKDKKSYSIIYEESEN